MKFPQIPIGQRFEWRGRIYAKSGPVAATDVESGHSQLIPRSAVISPIDAGQAPAKRPPPLPAEALGPALAAYRRETLAWARERLDAAIAMELDQAMEEIARRMVAEER